MKTKKTARRPGQNSSVSRQAASIARIRAERAEKNLCIDCGVRPRVRRKIVSTGKLKTLSRCVACLAAQR